MSKKIKVDTGFSKGRIETFYNFHIKYVSRGRFIDYGIYIVCLIVSVLGVFVFKEVLVTIISLFIIIIAIGTYSWRIYYTVKKHLKNNDMDSRPYTITIDDDKVIYIVSNEVLEFTWDKILWVKEIDNCFYIYVNENQALILTKYSLKDEELTYLRELFTSKSQYKKYKFYSQPEIEGVV